MTIGVHNLGQNLVLQILHINFNNFIAFKTIVINVKDVKIILLKHSLASITIKLSN